MRENKKTFFDEVIRAEAMVETGIANAERKAQKMIAEAETASVSLRSQTMEKLKTETEKQNKKLLEKQEKLEQEIFETATAEASKLKKDTQKKIEKIALELKKEVISCL